MRDMLDCARIPSTAVAAALAFTVGACGESSKPAELGPLRTVNGDVPFPGMRKGDLWEYETRGGDAPERWAIEVSEIYDAGRYRVEIVRPTGKDATPGTKRFADFAGPWNIQQPAPLQSLTYLQFPMYQGMKWTSAANSPGTERFLLTQEVKGQQTLQIAAAPVDCVRVEGVNSTIQPGPPPVTVAAPMRIWYCPTLRAVGRVETDVPTAPRVTHELVAYRLAK